MKYYEMYNKINQNGERVERNRDYIYSVYIYIYLIHMVKWFILTHYLHVLYVYICRIAVSLATF